MFPAYQDTGGRGGFSETNGNGQSYCSFPQSRLQSSRDYAEESRIKESRRRKAAQKAADEKIKKMKEDLTYRELYTRDSDEDDDDEYPSICLAAPSVTITTANSGEISKKHRQFVQPVHRNKAKSRHSSSDSYSSSEIRRDYSSISSRSSHRRHKKSKKSKKSRRERSRSRTPSPSRRSSLRGDDTLIYEGSERGSRRRFKHLSNKKKPDYDKFKSWHDVARANPEHSYYFAQYPDHENYTYDRLDKLDVIVCPSNVLTCLKNDQVYRDSKIETIAPKKKKSTRFHLVKFDREKYENSFRSHGFGFNEDFVPLAEEEEKFEEAWEIREREEHRSREQDAMLSLRREAIATGNTLDDEVIKIKAEINRNPKVASKYVDFIKAEDRVFEKDRMMGLQSNDRTALNERKLAILDEGIRHCGKVPILLLEKIEILKTTKPDEVEALWRDSLHHAPNDLNIHRAYLDYVQYDAQVYSQKKMSAAFTKTRLTLKALLSGSFVSHQPMEGTREMLLEIWIREMKWLLEQGFYAEALASIQASIEINHLCPSHIDNPAIKKAKFKEFWESGAPRIGDKEHNGGFLSFGALPSKQQLMDLERTELLEEINTCRYVYQSLNSEMTNPEAFVALEQTVESALFRPLRFHPNEWDPIIDELISDHVRDRHFVSYDDLILCDFVGNDCLMALSAFGLYIYSAPQFINWYAMTQDFGIKLGKPDIPPDIFCYLLRMQFRFIELVDQEFLYYTLVKNIVSFVVQKNDPGAEATALVILNGLESQFPAETPIFQLTKFQLYQTLMEWNILSKKRLVAVVSDVLEEVQRTNHPIMKRIALAYVLLATEHLNLDNEKMRVYMIKATLVVLGEPTDLNFSAIQFKDKLDEICGYPEIADGASDAMNNVLPSFRALITCIQLHFIACFPSQGSHNYVSLAERHLEWFSSVSLHDPRGVREATYTFIRILRRQWMENHGDRESLIKHLQFYLQNGNNCYDDRVIRIGIELLQTKSGTVLPQRRNDKMNPFAGAWKTDPLQSIYQTMEKIAISAKKTEGHPDSVRILREIMLNVIDKVAEQHREPFLWRVLIAEKQEAYTKAIAQCRWSKSIHLERIEQANSNRELQELWDLMYQTDIRLNVNIQDIPSYREIYDRFKT